MVGFKKLASFTESFNCLKFWPRLKLCHFSNAICFWPVCIYYHMRWIGYHMLRIEYCLDLFRIHDSVCIGYSWLDFVLAING